MVFEDKQACCYRDLLKNTRKSLAENCKEESNIFVIPKIPENGNVFFCGVGYLELFYTMPWLTAVMCCY